MKLSKLGAITQEFDSSDCNHASCPDLAKTISRLTRIPFVPAFAQKTDKVYHGRFASLGQSKPRLLESWNIRNPDGHPKYPTCGHLKIPHPARVILH